MVVVDALLALCCCCLAVRTRPRRTTSRRRRRGCRPDGEQVRDSTRAGGLRRSAGVLAPRTASPRGLPRSQSARLPVCPQSHRTSSRSLEARPPVCTAGGTWRRSHTHSSASRRLGPTASLHSGDVGDGVRALRRHRAALGAARAGRGAGLEDFQHALSGGALGLEGGLRKRWNGTCAVARSGAGHKCAAAAAAAAATCNHFVRPVAARAQPSSHAALVAATTMAVGFQAGATPCGDRLRRASSRPSAR